MLKELFPQLGLTAIESETYLALLEHGPTNAGSLAKKNGLPRSSLYGFLAHLAEKGLVRQSQKYNVKLWEAVPPERISQLLADQITALKSAQTNFSHLLPTLKKQPAADLTLPRIHYFEGRDQVRQSYKEILLYRDITSESFWPIKDMIEVLGPKVFIDLNRERIKRHNYIRAVWPANKVVDIKKYPFLGVGPKFLREIRQAPPGVTCSMGYWLFANNTLLVSSRRESFGLIVESSEFKQLLKTQFEVLWKLSRPIKVNPKYTQSFLDNL